MLIKQLKNIKMNKHWKLSLLISLFIGIVGLVIYLDHKTDENNKILLRFNLAQTISQNQAGEISVVDISSITTFSWDRLFVFAPYTSHERMDAILGRFWLGSRFTTIESSDRVTLIVFTKNGRVVQYLEFPRGQGDFSTADNGAGYAIEESRFVVDERGRMTWAYDK